MKQRCQFRDEGYRCGLVVFRHGVCRRHCITHLAQAKRAPRHCRDCSRFLPSGAKCCAFCRAENVKFNAVRLPWVYPERSLITSTLGAI